MGKIDVYEEVQLEALRCNYQQPDIWHQVSLAIETWNMTRTERLILKALEALHKEDNRD